MKTKIISTAVDENIQICEDIRKSKPEYYKSYWTSIHSMLLKIKGELGSNGKKNQ